MRSSSIEILSQMQRKKKVSIRKRENLRKLKMSKEYKIISKIKAKIIPRKIRNEPQTKI
jgi:hypothetical protein